MHSCESIKLTFQFLPTACMVIKPDLTGYTIVYANKPMLDRCGRSAESIVNCEFQEALRILSGLSDVSGMDIFRAVVAVRHTKQVKYVSYLKGDFFCTACVYPVFDERKGVEYIVINPFDRSCETQLPVSNMLESLNDGFFSVNNQWQVTYWNAHAEKLMKRSRALVIGQNLWALYPEAVHRKFHTEYHKTMETGISTHFEEYLYEEDVWLEVSAHSLKDGLLVYFRDITQRKKNERQLKQAKERYQSLFELSPLPTFVYSSSTLKILDVNEAALDYYGYSREQFLSMSLPDIKPARDLSIFDEIIREVVKPQLANSVLERHKKANGELIFVELVENNIPFNGVDASIVITMDVTEKVNAESVRRAAEEVQKETIELFDFVVKATGDAIYDCDVEGDKVTWSSGLTKIFGHQVDASFNHMNWLSLVHPDDLERIYPIRESHITGRKERLTLEYRFLCVDGTYKCVMDRSFLVYDTTGKLKRVIGAVHDITAQKKYVTDIETKNNRLAKLNWLQSNAVRTPLARIMSISELLSYDEVDKERKELLFNLLQSAKELDAVVREIIRHTEGKT